MSPMPPSTAPNRPSSSESMPPPPRPRRPGTESATTSTSTQIPSVRASNEPIEIDSDSDSDITMTTHSRNASSSSNTLSQPNTSSTNPPAGARSLQALAAQSVFNDLKNSLRGYESAAAYCCGGSLPFSSTPSSNAFNSAKAPITSPPVMIRFDHPHPSNPISKITLPFIPDQTESEEELGKLLEACAPATFGVGAKDVLDESYRKAGKLDRSQFSTDWHPADYGILDTIAQTLLPESSASLGEKEDRRAEHWGVRAELYKLNVYSAPSGRFQKHVDTPRGATQFGSLVVCLPAAHKGGQLLIQHKKHTSTFDWSNDNPNSLEWTAFYSDCEHEVLPVKSGHRITLTYNLYICERIGGILQRYPGTDPSLFPLYGKLRDMLEQPGFLQDGGTIGFACTHTYAHTSRGTERLMPYSLKGLDSVIFAVFSSLSSEYDIRATVRPLLSTEMWDEYDENRAEGGDIPSDDEDFDSETLERKASVDRVGPKFERIKMIDSQFDSYGDPTSKLQRYFPFQEFRNVLWLNEAHHEGWEVQLVNLKYGNEASLAWSYSHAVILVDVPPFLERVAVGERDMAEIDGSRDAGEAVFPDWHAGKRGKEGTSY